ncbi:hypothetical protein QR680_013231 [Steinernema hermaphroditum]|uniref:Tyrosine-protein phosphatase domain-containing protein n=1 Tax=Steinernema hermaphroditum TaxID=289476 RepID=A0AA39M1X1_9BILA|nr:hypothetical protein QR680_013231 [Steinernema hermaphroditum]
MREGGLFQRPPIVNRDRCRVLETLKAIRYRYVRNSTGMDEILPGLFLGNLRDSKDAQQLEEKRIEFVVSAHRSLEKFPETHSTERPKCKVLRVAINDNPAENIEQYFSTVCAFIHAARLQEKNVLVHCLMGVSRSAAFVAAYLLSATHLNYEEVFSFLSSRRPMVNPNFGFRMQLYKYCAGPRRNKERERLTRLSDRSLDLFYADCHFISPQIVPPVTAHLRRRRSKSENDLQVPQGSSQGVLVFSIPNLSQLHIDHFPSITIPFDCKITQKRSPAAVLLTSRYTKPPKQ